MWRTLRESQCLKYVASKLVCWWPRRKGSVNPHSQRTATARQQSPFRLKRHNEGTIKFRPPHHHILFSEMIFDLHPIQNLSNRLPMSNLDNRLELPAIRKHPECTIILPIGVMRKHEPFAGLAWQREGKSGSASLGKILMERTGRGLSTLLPTWRASEYRQASPRKQQVSLHMARLSLTQPTHLHTLWSVWKKPNRQFCSFP